MADVIYYLLSEKASEVRKTRKIIREEEQKKTKYTIFKLVKHVAQRRLTIEDSDNHKEWGYIGALILHKFLNVL